MRTYIRKKLQVQEIEDVQSLCRLCLGKTEQMVSIFGSDDDIFSGLHMRICACLGLEVSKDDVFPKLICQQCNSELDKFYTFKKSCTASYRKLKACLFSPHIKHADTKKDTDASNPCNVGGTPTTKASENTGKFNNNVDCNKLVIDLPINSLHMKEETVHEQEIILHENGLDVDTGSHNDSEERDKEDCHTDPVFGLSEQEVQASVDIQTNENEVLDYAKTQQQETKEVSATAETVQCLPDFIVTNLIQQGVLARRDSALEILDQNMKSFTLETPCGTEVLLELVEEEPIRSANDQNKPSRLEIFNSNLKSNVSSGGGGGCCGACGARFRSRCALERHARTHSGERPFACAACGRRFTQPETLRRHQLLHNDKLPWQCARCPAAYSQRGALQQHARSHAPPAARPLVLHRCSRCPKVFLYPSGLSRHMSVHEGKQWGCDECSRTFADKSSLQRHRRAHQRRSTT